MTIESTDTAITGPLGGSGREAGWLATFPGSAVVQLVSGDPLAPDALVAELHGATVAVTDHRISAIEGDFDWSWLVEDVVSVVHGGQNPWTIFGVAGISDFGVSVPAERAAEFRRLIADFASIEVRHQHIVPPSIPSVVLPAEPAAASPADAQLAHAAQSTSVPLPVPLPLPPIVEATADVPPASLLVALTVMDEAADTPTGVVPIFESPVAVAGPTPDARRANRFWVRPRTSGNDLMAPAAALAGIDARNISAWFGSHQVLDRVSLDMRAGEVTALIGPSGCGKSTFLRILNRMHEMISLASMAGEVMLDGHDIYDPERKLTDARREIGMVFQKPNPFPAMSIYDNVLASLRLTGVKASQEMKDDLVESCLTKAGLWNETRNRLREPGGGLSGGQQQRLCIARALAIRPRVLLMDEPCSALDPTSTRRIEETVMELVSEVTIVIVTHNMQQALRVSNRCAFFLAEQGTPGLIVEHGPTQAMFHQPQDQRTNDYVNGRFG